MTVRLLVATGALLLLPATAASAATTPTTSPTDTSFTVPTTPATTTATTATPTVAPSPAEVVVGTRVDPAQATILPVDDVTGAVEDLVFAQGSADGAVTDLGDRSFTLSSDVLFAFDKATLTSRAKKEITRIAGVLQQNSDRPVTQVSVTGFTDEVGSDSYNAGLSRRRAEAVRTTLAPLLGAEVKVTSAGRGEADPVATNKTTKGRQLNRRVEIRAT